MGKRKVRNESVNYLPCDVCGAAGGLGHDVNPYWWGRETGHKWCHSACAEQYRQALVAAQRGEEVEDYKQAEPEGQEEAQVDFI
jgi:hypothetical protein